MKHYGILGSGTCGENIIEDGLRDLGSENVTYHIIPRFKASSNEKRIYDFLLENEVDYNAWYEGKAPDILVESAVSASSVNNAEASVLAYLRDNDGTLLLMWDGANEEHMYSICTKADADGIPIFELTNGLSPISFSDNKPVEENYELPVDLGTYKVEVTPVTKPDIKKNIVESTVARTTLEAPEGDCMVTVVMPNGTVISTPATVEEVRVLLGLSGGVGQY